MASIHLETPVIVPTTLRSHAIRVPGRSHGSGPFALLVAVACAARIAPAVIGRAALVLLAASTLVAATCDAAAAYPSKPVRIVVGFAPGGVADITARMVAQKLGERMGHPFVVENRPSAGGVVAAEAVARAAPDGHTLLLVSNGNAVSVSLLRSLPVDPAKDFAMISTIGSFGLAVLAGPQSRLATLVDVIAQARAEPSRLNVATIGVGSTQNLAAELFRSMAGVDLVIVPFKGTPEVIAALKANEVQVGFEILAPVLGQVRGGGLKAIAVTTPRRFAGLPAVPTVIESGLPGYEVESWNGLAAPAKTPPDVVARLSAAVNEVVALPEIRQRFQELGVVARGSTPEGLQALMVREIARWGEVVRRAGIPRQ